jgi:hypothetical protein
VNAFEVAGSVLAVWAVVLAALGISREGFPGKAEKLVAAISVILVAIAIGSAIYVGVTEKKGGVDKGAAGLPV